VVAAITHYLMLGALRRSHQLVMLAAMVHVMAVVPPDRAVAQAKNSGDEHPPVLDTQRHIWPGGVIERWADHRKLFDGRLAADGAARNPLLASHPRKVIGGQGAAGLGGHRVAGGDGEYVAKRHDRYLATGIYLQVRGYAGEWLTHGLIICRRSSSPTYR
jgi:hypothetical protein